MASLETGQRLRTEKNLFWVFVVGSLSSRSAVLSSVLWEADFCSLPAPVNPCWVSGKGSNGQQTGHVFSQPASCWASVDGSCSSVQVRVRLSVGSSHYSTWSLQPKCGNDHIQLLRKPGASLSYSGSLSLCPCLNLHYKLWAHPFLVGTFIHTVLQLFGYCGP